ncbi:ABC1-domain-containing protein [Violaceomyces palustris]|uniref:ABC1-domain-containing protein n=1 Tax=Violaceomyces palustris TaxID=1673888 RepID=A0ACD0NW47_9BASI|nr:ABC1-domain-containing protein [Violaceomyces palustris]
MLLSSTLRLSAASVSIHHSPCCSTSQLPRSTIALLRSLPWQASSRTLTTTRSATTTTTTATTASTLSSSPSSSIASSTCSRASPLFRTPTRGRRQPQPKPSQTSGFATFASSPNHDQKASNDPSRSETTTSSAPPPHNRKSPADERPFRKKYPPVVAMPKPINFDKPAIPNPIETAAAHQRFRSMTRKVLLRGSVLVALVVGGGLYFGKEALMSEEEVKGLDRLYKLPHEEVGRQVEKIPGSIGGSYALLAISRSTTIAKAVALCVWDYRKTLNAKYSSKEEEREELRRCHLRSAQRVLVALQTNGGLYIKLGQHLSSVILLPVEWTSTLRPLQDQNTPTPLPELEVMFKNETGMSFQDAFSEIDPNPIGVASLAQVHRAVDKKTGEVLAIKMMHPEVERFSHVDMETVNVLVNWVKKVFPEFSFEWLAQEMNENMPLEMDFRHEAKNASRAREDFSGYRKTSVYIPEVRYVFKRVMAMEFIDGRRPDDLDYLALHRIDRNRVSQELSRVFSQMLYLHGFFHADPHGGNVLIRPAPKGSRSKYNFEVVLLDHGLYFDIDEELRSNYARFWLSLLKRATPQVSAERRRYAKLIADIDDDLYPILESAITGRAGLEGSDPNNPLGIKDRNRASSLLDMEGGSSMSDEEQEHIRKTVMEKEGLFLSILELLRRVPRRMLMVLKLNDLTRSLDASLHTTHGSIRPFLISARYCSLAVRRNDSKHLRQLSQTRGRFDLQLWTQWISSWSQHLYFYRGLALLEILSDWRAGILVYAKFLSQILTGKGWKSARRGFYGIQDVRPSLLSTKFVR